MTTTGGLHVDSALRWAMLRLEFGEVQEAMTNEGIEKSFWQRLWL